MQGQSWIEASKPVKYYIKDGMVFKNPNIPNRQQRRHSVRRMRCDGNGARTLGRV